ARRRRRVDRAQAGADRPLLLAVGTRAQRRAAHHADQRATRVDGRCRTPARRRPGSRLPDRGPAAPAGGRRMSAIDARLSALRLVMVTDGRGDGPRILAALRAAIDGGLRAVQLREPGMSARALAALCEALRELLDPLGGLVLVNDRADVAA